MSTVLVDVVFYNVLYSQAWDPNFPGNKTELNGQPALKHKMEKYYRRDWRDAYGGGGEFNHAIPVADLAKFKKFTAIFDADTRYKRIVTKLAAEIDRKATPGASRPIVCMSEVQAGWAKKFAGFFAEKKYVFQYEPGCEQDKGYYGTVVAFPSEGYAVAGAAVPPRVAGSEALARVVSSGRPRRYPMEGIESPDSSAVRACIDAARRAGASPELDVGGLNQVFEETIKNPYNQKPILALPLRVLGAQGNGGDADMRCDFLFCAYHMPMSIFWKPKPSGDSKATAGAAVAGRAGRRPGDIVMDVHAFAAMRKFAQIRRSVAPGAPVVVVGDWNTTPADTRFDYFLGRDTARKRTKDLSNHVINALFASDARKGGKRVQGEPLPSLAALDDFKLAQVYKKKHGMFPELTTHTQEFHGAIDHAFVSEDVGVEHANAMPTRKELLQKGVWTPNLESEPSDHFLQRTVFRIGVDDARSSDTAQQSQSKQ